MSGGLHLRGQPGAGDRGFRRGTRSADTQLRAGAAFADRPAGNFTPTKIDRRIEQIEQSIQRYLEEMETADRTQPVEAPAKAKRLDRKIERLREQMKHLGALKQQLQSQDDQQHSTTDAGVVGYNVQAAFDAKHHLVVTHEVTNNGSDRGQLANMALKAKGAMVKPTLHVIADRGYFSGPEIKACEEAGIAAYVPKPMTSNSRAEGRYSKADFIYVARDDQYQCPAGERLRWRQTTKEKGLRVPLVLVRRVRRLRAQGAVHDG